MTSVLVLTGGFDGYKSRSLCLPISRYIDSIESRGIRCRTRRHPARIDSFHDVLIVEDQVVTSQDRSTRAQLQQLREHTSRLLWFDTSDSTGTVDTEVVPLVDGYYKKQLLTDREQYLDPWRGSRPFTEYYYDQFDIDAPGGDGQAQIAVESDLDKLGVFWNIGLDLQFPGSGTLFKHLPDAISKRVPWSVLLNGPRVWAGADRLRSVAISARFSKSFEERAVEFHRRQMIETLGDRVESDKLSTIQYWRELRTTKLLLSPFGWGEICRRDFEGFMSGCLVVKPLMEHLDTWPPLYEDSETVLGVDWDMSDLDQRIEWALENDTEARKIARTGQSRYYRYLASDEAGDLFAERFADIVGH